MLLRLVKHEIVGLGRFFIVERVVFMELQRRQKSVRMITPEDKVNNIRDRMTTERTQNFVVEIKQTSYTSPR